MNVELTQKSHVESFIEKNIEVLEDSLNKKAQKYLTIQKHKKNYDFGHNIKPEKLNELSCEVIQDTKKFLKITNAPPVNFSMFYPPRDLKKGINIGLGTFTFATLAESINGLTINDLKLAGGIAIAFGGYAVLNNIREHSNSCYDVNNIIKINEKKEVNLVGVIAHEYTHHLQHSLTDLIKNKRNPIVEGHARGVEEIIANNFAQRYDNFAYMFDPLSRTTKELKHAYSSICKKKRINPKKSLINLPISEPKGLLCGSRGYHYSIGFAAMSIAETQQGKKIYRDILKNDSSFLSL